MFQKVSLTFFNCTILTFRLKLLIFAFHFFILNIAILENTTHTTEDLRALTDKIQQEAALMGLLSNEMSKVIVGQHYMVNRLLIALLANGHILLEGVPGLAKTLAIKTLSDAIGAQFSRVQFTPNCI